VVDHLGSTRLLTNYNGPSVIECDDYYPFGEQVSCGGTSTTTHKFTGYERDAESGLDNAQARYNSSSLGRFMSPDPIGNFVADPTNPQTWNLYTYVDNDPTGLIDPSGLTSIDPNQPPKRGLNHTPALIYWDCDVDQFLPNLVKNGDGNWYNAGGLFSSWTCTENAFLIGNRDDGSPLRLPSPQPPKPQCQSQYQQTVSAAQSKRKDQFLTFFTAVGVPGDILLVACSFTEELMVPCTDAVETALGGPSVTGAFAFEHQYNTTVDDARQQLQACQQAEQGSIP
jgi:RHS repeat-associated protein